MRSKEGKPFELYSKLLKGGLVQKKLPLDAALLAFHQLTRRNVFRQRKFAHTIKKGLGLRD